MPLVAVWAIYFEEPRRRRHLLPSSIIHIGSAATVWGQWDNDPALKCVGLTSGQDIERLFIDQAMRTLLFHGRRAATWDTATHETTGC